DRASTASRAIADRKSAKAGARPVRVPARRVHRDPTSREFHGLNDSARAAATSRTLTVRAAGSRDPVLSSPRTAAILCTDSAAATVRRSTAYGDGLLP